MRRIIPYILVGLGVATAQVGEEIPTRPETTVMDTAVASSNEYIHEDWDYFAERMRNEFLALGEKKYRAGEFKSAVIDYYNFLYHFPEDDLIPLVHYRIGRAYERLQEFGLAREQYIIVRDDSTSDRRVRVVCLRQLARMDYEVGRYEAVLALPPMEDPYLLVLKAFASLTMENWVQSGELVRRAYKYYPRGGQFLLDSLLTEVDRIPTWTTTVAGNAPPWRCCPAAGCFTCARAAKG